MCHCLLLLIICWLCCRNDPQYISSLGMTVLNVCRVVPHGVLVFFPSYTVLYKCKEEWQLSGLWSKIAAYKVRSVGGGCLSSAFQLTFRISCLKFCVYSYFILFNSVALRQWYCYVYYCRVSGLFIVTFLSETEYVFILMWEDGNCQFSCRF